MHIKRCTDTSVITPLHNSPNSNIRGACPCGVMVKAMDCEIIAREFELQSRYYVHFRANTLGRVMNPHILPAIGYIAPPLF